MTNHSNTKVLLIGNSIFEEDKEINPIPNVMVNLDLLYQTLVNPKLVGVPKSNIILLRNEDKQTIEDNLHSITTGIKEKNHALIIYYSGHGMYSDEDYSFYLTANNTRCDNLLVSGIDTAKFKQLINRCRAGTKILILDCCHSGDIIGNMGVLRSKIQSNISDFTGTYVMTSSSKNEPSLFPPHAPQKPTYFTGQLLDVINNGLDEGPEYCSFHDLFAVVKDELYKQGLPEPQQANYNNAEGFYLARNKKYVPGKQKAKPLEISSVDEKEIKAWNEAEEMETIEALEEFIKKYPNGFYASVAEKTINIAKKNQLINEQRVSQPEMQAWGKAQRADTIESYLGYLKSYPRGIYAEVAKLTVEVMKDHQKSVQQQEERPITDWLYPRTGLRQDIASGNKLYTPGSRLQRLIRKEETPEEKAERAFWKEAISENTEIKLQAYLKKYPTGRYTYQARRSIQKLNFHFYKDWGWWLIFVFIIGISIMASLFSFNLYNFLIKKLDGNYVLDISTAVLVFIGLAWGLVYAFKNITDVANRGESFNTLLEPFRFIFDPYEGGDIRVGLFSAIFINNLLILGLVALVQYLLHFIPWDMGHTLMVILYAAIHVTAMCGLLATESY